MSNHTSTAPENLSPEGISDPLKRLTASVAFVLQVATASLAETRRTFLHLTSSTSLAALSTADTSFHSLTPEVQARLDSILEGVRYQIVEDGMANMISDRLPELVANPYPSVLPAIAALITGNRTSSSVTAELLKEVGRVRDAASHSDRRWLLEHALSSLNPAARDGASVGLAWRGDAAPAPSVRAAIGSEHIPQLKADLEEVLRLLTQPNTNGAAPQDHKG